MEKNQRIVLASRPAAWVEESNFRFEESDIPQPGDNQVLVKNHWLSLDPYMRGRMSDVKSYATPVQIGEVMVGGCAGEVVSSKHPKFAPGDKVVGALGWQLYGVADGAALQKVDASVIPLSAYLGPVGMPGVTAWVGLNDICAPKEGETVVVTAASGAVGSVVGQLAKLKGARAVGIAGGAEKCRYVVEELGFDACIDYKAGNLRGDLKSGHAQGHRLPVRERRRRNLRHPARAHEPLRPHRRLRPHRAVQLGALPDAEHRLGADQPHQDAGLHRLGRPEPLAAGAEGTRRPGRHRQAQVPRDCRRTASPPHPPPSSACSRAATSASNW
jgi:hypothetical protein